MFPIHKKWLWINGCPLSQSRLFLLLYTANIYIVHTSFITISGGHDEACCFNNCYCSKTQRRCLGCGIATPIVALVILILAVVIRTSMVESPFVLNKLDAHPRFINASAQDIQRRAKNLGKVFILITYSPLQKNLPFANFQKIGVSVSWCGQYLIWKHL